MSKYILALLAFALIASNSSAQLKPITVDSTLTLMYKKFKQAPDKRAAEKEVEKILDQTISKEFSKLQASLTKNSKQEEQMLREFNAANQHKTNGINLLPLWEQIPPPVSSLPSAKQANIELTYGGYEARVALEKEKIGAKLQQQMNNGKNSEAQLKADAIKMSNQSAVVQQMGGTEALMNMSEAERKAAAMKMKNDMQNNPGAMTGVSDPGMNAMMQKVMNDPAYREKFSKMSEKEKQEEMKKFMSNQPVARNDAAREASMKDKNDSQHMIEFQLLVDKTVKNMVAATQPFTDGTRDANAYFESLYGSIRSWYKKQYDALPIVVMGEMREKEGVDILDKTSAMMFYLVQKKEATVRADLWNGLKVRTKLTLGDFNDYVNKYDWDAHANKSILDPGNSAPQVVKAIDLVYAEMLKLNGEAAGQTRVNKGNQEHYEFMLK